MVSVTVGSVPADTDHPSTRPTAPPCFPDRPSPTRARPPTRKTERLPASALRWTVLLHHNTHVHTFVGGTGARGASWPRTTARSEPSRYEIILTATDSSGLKSSTSVNLPVGSDTSPPTAPTGLTATRGRARAEVDLSWTASTDDVGGGGYRVERCQGQGCTQLRPGGGADAGPRFSDTGLSPSTTYRYRVRAVDASGNLSGYSNVAEATTGARRRRRRVWSGRGRSARGSGATTADASGNGNTGTITGATWTTQGRFGNALSFNGASSVVRVASSASLNLTSAMTLSAWIRPTAAQSGWRTIVQRQADAYFLNASNDGARCARRAAARSAAASSTSAARRPTRSTPGRMWR